MAAPRKILFVLPELSGGGAERVVVTLLRYLDRTRFLPVLVLLQKRGPFLSQLPQDLRVIDLKSPRVRYALPAIVRLLKRERPDLLFSTLGHMNLAIAALHPLFGKRIGFIARESNTVSVENSLERYPRLFDWLYRRLYNRFDLIIAQSGFMKEDLVREYGIDAERIEVIHNPLDTERECPPRTPKKGDTCRLLGIGRLSYQKGFDLLLEVMKGLDRRFTLTILGEGEERRKLEELIAGYGLKERVQLVGFCDDPTPFMAEADLLVLSSRYEGLPNVVLEANLCGTPVVAFDAPGGTAEIVHPQRNGFLVEAFDLEAMRETIERACAFPFDREVIRADAIERFDARKIVRRYEALLERL